MVSQCHVKPNFNLFKFQASYLQLVLLVCDNNNEIWVYFSQFIKRLKIWVQKKSGKLKKNYWKYGWRRILRQHQYSLHSNYSALLFSKQSFKRVVFWVEKCLESIFDTLQKEYIEMVLKKPVNYILAKRNKIVPLKKYINNNKGYSI